MHQRHYKIKFKIFIMIVPVFFALSTSFSWDYEDYDVNQLISIENNIQTIYDFQKMMNQSSDPTFIDAQYFFAKESSLEYFFIECSCIFEEKSECHELYDENKPSLFFSYLRSTDGPIFEKSDKNRKIEIYINLNVDINKSIYEKWKKYFKIIEGVILVDQKRTVKCAFILPGKYGFIDVTGRLVYLYINDKGICDIYGAGKCKLLQDYRGP